ncbi:hypothetical protein V8C43DRAFT_291276 [Trichoderma afarasin]
MKIDGGIDKVVLHPHAIIGMFTEVFHRYVHRRIICPQLFAPTAKPSNKFNALGIPLAAGGVRKWLPGSLKCRTHSRMSPTKQNDKPYVIKDIIDSERSKFEFVEEKRTIWDRILPIRRTRMVGRMRGGGMKSTTKQVGYGKIPLVNATTQGNNG